MSRNVRGAYVHFTHDRAADWDWLAKWQPNVIRYMGQGSIANANSFDLARVVRLHQTCPDATILLRCWEVDDNNFTAHDAMVANPRGEAERQINWWAQVIARAESLGIPRDKLMAGLNNETGPEKDAALFVYSEEALKLGTEKRVRLGVCVFSAGRPALEGESQYDIRKFSQLDSLVSQNQGAFLLHEYMQPEGMYAVWTDAEGDERKDYTYLIGRHLRWQIKSPIIIAEWGIDGILYNRHPDPVYGNSGWRNFPKDWPPSRFADEYVECVRVASDNVIGICPFISDFADHKWQSFDVLDAYGELLARKDLCVKEASTPPTTIHLPSISNGSEYYVSVPAGANIRSAPQSGTVLTAVPYGEHVQVVGIDTLRPDWAQVRYGDVQGWMYRELLSAEKPVTVDDGPQVPTPTGDNWPRIYSFVKRWEGGWADNPNDPGGATNKGITIGTFIRWRTSQGQPTPTKDDLRNISDAEAEQIFREWYYEASGADKLPWPLSLAHTDTAVNAGVGRAQEMLGKSNGNFMLYMAELIDWYTRIGGFEHFGKAWIRRRADILRAASA